MATKSRVLISTVHNIMINLDKITSNFDIQNLDAAQFTKILNEHQHSLIKGVLIIGTLLMAWSMFHDYRTKEQGLRTGMSQAQEKLDALKVRDGAVKDFNNFKSSLPNKLNEFELIALISKYAKLQHVTIISLAPAESRDMGYYDAIDVSFAASSGNFKDMVLFLRKIEKSVYPLKVNSWFGNEGEDGKIAFTIAISAVLIHT